jgi:glycosyltransferase involved in cell wall biosynthesis
MPIVSVILPVHGVEQTVERTIASLRSQTFSDFEVICVNDATTDNSIAVARAATAGDKRFRFVHNDVNRGLGGARNAGLDEATGTYVQFVDSDDWLHPFMIETLVREAEAHEADWVQCAPFLAPPSGPSFVAPFHTLAARQRALLGPIDLAVAREVTLDMWPSMWLGLRRRSRIPDTLRFQEEIHFEDHLFHYRFAALAETLVYLERPLYYYRLGRDGAITSDKSERNLEMIEVVKHLIDHFAQDPILDRADEGVSRTICRLLLERYCCLDRQGEAAREFRARAALRLAEVERRHARLSRQSGSTRFKNLQEFAQHMAPEWSSPADVASLFGFAPLEHARPNDQARPVEEARTTVPGDRVAHAGTDDKGRTGPLQRFLQRQRTRRVRRARRLAKLIADELRDPQ